MAKSRLDINALPADPIARREVLELRAVPNAEKPKLPAEVETQLARTEERCAQTYIDMEECTYRLNRLNKRLKNGVVPSGLSMVRRTVDAFADTGVGDVESDLENEKTNPERKLR